MESKETDRKLMEVESAVQYGIEYTIIAEITDINPLKYLSWSAFHLLTFQNLISHRAKTMISKKYLLKIITE